MIALKNTTEIPGEKERIENGLLYLRVFILRQKKEILPPLFFFRRGNFAETKKRGEKLFFSYLKGKKGGKRRRKDVNWNKRIEKRRKEKPRDYVGGFFFAKKDIHSGEKMHQKWSWRRRLLKLKIAASFWRRTSGGKLTKMETASSSSSEHYGSLNRGNKGTSSAGGSHSLGTTPKGGEQQEEAAEMGVGIRRKRRRKEDWPNQANPILPPSSSVFMLFRLECPTVLLSFRGKGEGAEWAFLCKEGEDIPTPPLRTLVRSFAEGGDFFDQKGKSCSCETVLWERIVGTF